MTDALGFLAATWGVMMAVSPALQVRRILERHSSADISIAYLAVLQVGFTLWVAYGISLRNPAIIVPNAVALLVGAATIAIAFRFRGRLPVTWADASAADAALEQAQEATGKDGAEADAHPGHRAGPDESQDGDEHAEHDERAGSERRVHAPHRASRR